MNRRDWMKSGLLLPSLGLQAEALTATTTEQANTSTAVNEDLQWGNTQVKIRVKGSTEALWILAAESKEVKIGPPSISVNGVVRTAVLNSLKRKGSVQDLGSGISEQSFIGSFTSDPALSLEIVFRLARDNPVVRFRYILHAPSGVQLTGDGTQLCYLSLSFADMTECLEVQLSAFNEMLHSYTLAELPIALAAFEDQSRLVGPILAAQDNNEAFLIAYEHGAQIPDSFLEYQLDSEKNLTLQAKKANYLSGKAADGYSTVWMQAAATKGGLDALAAEYRRFLLRGLSVHEESRQPYIFYNTWNFQERNKWFNGKAYLDSMNQERILAEINVAHKMGIDVFVMDTGWYEKTGDWEVSHVRFPNLLADIKNKLDGYGMKLGLWFNPTAAAKSSRMLAANRQCVRSREGKEVEPRPVWETEESYAMCLVSPYSDALADTLIRVAKQTGASYLKWDAIAQYGCDSPHHWHGTEANSVSERWNSYAFQLPQQMARVAEKIASALPQIIIDFDITESGRAVGLSFLTAGKYFLINNGPYLFNYDLPLDREHQNWNLFFYPGPARTWICRSALLFDKWIPSVLFLTHYFPDDPESSQLINVASLILGQNGIWGNLPAVSSEGIERISGILRRYKQIRDDITESSPVVTGSVGSSSEIHEKVSARTGKGAVVLFANATGKYIYVTAHKPNSRFWSSGDVRVRYDTKGRALIEAEFRSAGAAIVFFGVSSA